MSDKSQFLRTRIFWHMLQNISTFIVYNFETRLMTWFFFIKKTSVLVLFNFMLGILPNENFPEKLGCHLRDPMELRSCKIFKKR